MDKLSKIVNALSEGDQEVDRQQIRKNYFAEDELTLADINVEVDGVGNIAFPLAENYIESLLSVSSKAKFGLRDQTLLDENVRDTNEIASEKLCVTIEPTSLSRVLNKMRRELGLDENSVLTAHLHNMLIYKRGQFFQMHQDKEKMDNMIATLVIVLPSSHVGGDLVIHQGDKKHVFSTENINETRVKCIGFYADCRHEIQKVQHGHRVALTYNLVLHSPLSVQDNIVNQKLKIAIEQYFADSHSGTPKLVYFLNHEYTEHGLRWDMLKGLDRINANNILKVASNLKMVPHLALVKIQESYSTCGGPYDKDPETYELIESRSEVTLSYWLDRSNKKLPYDELEIETTEFCYSTDTAKTFKPYKTEYEGYQGNWSGDKTFWYRRGAVVLWEESSQIPLNFWLNNHNAIKDMLQLTDRPGNEKQILDVVQKAGGYLIAKGKNSADCFIMLAKIALYVNDNNAACNLLSQFPRPIVSVATAESLAKLQNKYGIDWCLNILNKMKIYSDNCNIDKIDFFMKIFVENNGALKVAELLLDQQVIEKDEYVYHYYAGLSSKLPERFVKLNQLFRACATVQNVAILHKIINLIIASPSKYRIIPLVDLFLNLKGEIHSAYYVNFEPLKTYLLKAVNDELALGRHSDDDWSIQVKMSCNCEYCNEALAFLNSKTEVRKRWPLREKLRNHVRNRLCCLRLPLNITVESSGSPHKLILEKDISMHQKSHDRYREFKGCQDELNKHTF